MTGKFTGCSCPRTQITRPSSFKYLVAVQSSMPQTDPLKVLRLDITVCNVWLKGKDISVGAIALVIRYRTIEYCIILENDVDQRFEPVNLHQLKKVAHQQALAR